MYHSACRVSKDLGGQMPVFLKNNKEKSWKEEGMDVRVEHSTLLCWKNYSLYLSIKTFKPTTPVIPIWSITNTHVLLKCLGSQFIKAEQPSRPCTHVVLPDWSLPQSPSPGCSSQKDEDEPVQASATVQARGGSGSLHTSHPLRQVSWNAWSPCIKHKGNCNHAYTK